MAVFGDRAVAGLLSALAEAPDFQAAASFLVAQLVDLTAAPRAYMLRLDEAQENIDLVAAGGADADFEPLSIPVGDLSSPLVISMLALVPIRGDGIPPAPRSFSDLTNWYVLPMTQPRYRGAREIMTPERAAELIASANVSVLLSGERRLGVSPAGVVLLEGPVSAEALDASAEFLALASPVVARVASLENVRDFAERLSQQRD